MKSKYQTWEGFREFLKGQVHEPLPDCLWDMLESVLDFGAVHPPYSKHDVDDVIKQIDRLRVFMRALGE